MARKSPIIIGRLYVARVDVSERNTLMGLDKFDGPPVQSTALSLSLNSKVMVTLRRRKGKHLEAQSIQGQKESNAEFGKIGVCAEGSLKLKQSNQKVSTKQKAGVLQR